MVDRNNVVYKHTSPSGKVYIGITCLNPSRRWNSGKGYKMQAAIGRAIKKYGWENFSHEILAENLTRAEASQKEQENIRLFQSDDPRYGYNCTSGGDSQFYVSDEVRAKEREAKRRYISEHPEYAAKISATITSLWRNEGYRRRMSAAISKGGKEHYRLHPERALAAGIRSKQRWDNPDFRQKMKIRLADIKPSEYAIMRSIECRQTPVLCVDANRVFASLDDAAAFANVRKSCIRDCCLGIQETSGKYHWRYESDTENDWIQRRNDYYALTGVSRVLSVVRIEDGSVFKNAHEAALSVNGDNSSIVACCRGKRKTAYGFHWSYLGDEELSNSEKRERYTHRKTSSSKSVRCIETGTVFHSAQDAASWVNGAIGGTYQSILKCCRGERKSTHGYHWEYAD